MPEGDSVWRAAAQLHAALAGQQLTASDFRVPRFATLKLAGIGNIYRCEACFLSRIHPAAPVSAVSDLPAIMADAKQLLEANLGPGRRTTVLNARGTPVGRQAGRPGYWVYGREHQPCLKCGTPIRRGVLGKDTGTEERDIYFCPTCQPPPGANA